MKALVKLTGIVVFVFLSVSVKAQSLRIVYHFLQDEIHCYKTTPNDKKGKPISTPVVGRNQIITVEVVNFNKFVFAADETYTSKVVEMQSEMCFLDLMGTMVNPMSATGFFTALGGTLPDEIGRGGVLSTRGASSAYDDIRDAYNKLTGIEATAISRLRNHQTEQAQIQPVLANGYDCKLIESPHSKHLPQTGNEPE
ncbi:hypothetical protein N9W53_00430 [bacterium]|nr:hypothetical protein [bacterium]